MTADFRNYAVNFLIPHEGTAFENDPDDDGNKGDGRTPGNFGTKFGVDAHSHPGVNIVGLTFPEAIDIHFKEWVDDRADDLPWPISAVTFDEEVNGGVWWGSVHLQAALNMQKGLALDGDTIPVDGKIGPLTIKAAACANVLEVTNAMLELRVNRYLDIAHRLPAKAKFLAGWLNRVEDLRSFVLKAAPGQQAVS